MKILVFSDSHKNVADLLDVIEREKPDRVMHLGDHLHDAEDLQYAFDRIPFTCVPGNCDYAPTSPGELLTELGGVRLFLAHGHQYGVKGGTDRLLARALSLQAQIALFGHTHRPYLEQRSGIWLMNPGASQRSGKQTYGEILITGGRISCRICDFYDEVLSHDSRH